MVVEPIVYSADYGVHYGGDVSDTDAPLHGMFIGALKQLNDTSLNPESKTKILTALQSEELAIDPKAIVIETAGDDKEYGRLTLFHWAALNGHDWLLKPLDEAGCDPNAMSEATLETENPPTHVLWGALDRGFNDVLHVWLEARWKIDDELLSELLDSAVSYSNQEHWKEALELLLNDSAIAERLKTNPSIAVEAMHYAVADDNTAMIERLLDFGIPVDVTTSERPETPLFTALTESCVNAYHRLRKAGADLWHMGEDKNKDGINRYGHHHPWDLMHRKLTHTHENLDEGKKLPVLMNDEDKEEVAAFRSIVSDILSAGYDAHDSEALSLLRETTSQEYTALAHVLISEGFSLIQKDTDGDTQEEFCAGNFNDGYANCRDHRQVYEALWQKFENGWNPFIGDKPQWKHMVGKPSDPSTHYVSPHPLGLLHAFAAIGKLEEAFDSRYWQGKDGVVQEDSRRAIFDQLYPFEKAIAAREMLPGLIQQHDAVTEKPLRNWVATVQTPQAGVSDAVAVGGAL